MSTIQKPDSTDEMIQQLWYAFVGTNGDGLASRLRRVEDTVVKLHENNLLYLASRDSTCPKSEDIDKAVEAVMSLKEAPAKRSHTIVIGAASAAGLLVLERFVTNVLPLLGGN